MFVVSVTTWMVTKRKLLFMLRGDVKPGMGSSKLPRESPPATITATTGGPFFHRPCACGRLELKTEN